MVDYSSGSGGTTLTFIYTIDSDDNAIDLDYSSTGALVLNNATIKDAAGNAATLTLELPGSSNSLASNKALVVDGLVPIVSSVSSSTTDGYYNEGDTLLLTVSFSEAVTVTGTPQLALETGATDAVANYTTGSNSSVLVFRYIVTSGNNSSDLDYDSTNALSLNGGTIADVAGNNAILTLAVPAAANSLGANKAIIIDSATPIISSVTSTTADGSYNAGEIIIITINFNEPVYVSGTPQLILETGSTDAMAEYSSGSGDTTLIFSYTIASGNNSNDLGYASTSALSLNSGTILDCADNPA